MKVDVLMPKLGESITEGTIVKWWKQPGESVKKDETLLEISTDKVDSEIPSPFEGVLVELKANENDTVEVDGVIAIIDTEASAGTSSETPTPAQASTDVAKSEPAQAQEPAVPVAQATGNSGGIMEVEMPKLGESITEGTIVKWWKKAGDTIAKDETLLEISTDKVDSEIPSPFAGTIVEILSQENETVEVGSIIAKIQSGEAVAASRAQPAPAPVAEVAPSNHEPVATTAATTSTVVDTVPARAGNKFFSPLVRSIARKENISMAELQAIPGSGLEGRVTKNDVLGYIERGRVAPPVTKPAPATASPAAPAPAAAPAPKPAAPAPSAEEIAAKWQGESVEVVPMDNIRKAIADHMVKSKHTSPHVYGVAEVDFTNIVNIVKKHRDAFKQREGLKLTMNPMILFSVIKAIKEFPDINCSVEGHNVIRKRFVNIGMAVATERGLIVPVLKQADERNFLGVARNAYDLAIKARDRKLTLDDIQGSTFTITNYGVFGNMIGFPIINQPNVAIMGVGAIKKRPVVIETEQGDVIGIRSIGFLTLSYDHRIVDGELGDKFLQRVRYYLENFQEDWM